MSDFARVKAAVSLLEVITSETGLQMGKTHLQACPFCDGHGCFSIQDDKGRFKCFQCDKSGDVFEFFQQLHNCTAAEALHQIAEKHNIPVSKPAARTANKLQPHEQLLMDAAAYYHQILRQNGGGEYMTNQRGHTMDTLQRLKVGYTDGLLKEHLRSIGYSPAQMLTSGLVTEKQIKGSASMLDFFAKGLVIFPHFGNGKLLHFTIKDPEKKKKYQLPAAKRSPYWRFFNQDALSKHDEIFLVEGENDLASIMDGGFFNVMACIGQISDAQSKHLVDHCRDKSILLWMDNDDAGKRYIRKISEAIGSKRAKIIVYPDDFKDPDDFLRKVHDRRQTIAHLQSKAIDYIGWEISQASGLPTLEDKLEHLEHFKIFNKIVSLPEIEQQIHIERLVLLGFSESAILDELEKRIEIRHQLSTYFKVMGSPRNADPIEVAQMIYKFFSAAGKFFKTRQREVFLLYRHNIYEISNNLPFNSLMMEMTKLLPSREPGRSVWVALANLSYRSGIEIEMSRWIHTDRMTDDIYANMNSEGNVILKISHDGISEIENGLNQDNILLRSSRNIKPFRYLPEADMHEGLTALKKLLLDSLTCEREQRYLIICWMISAFLIDFMSSQILMKFSGATKAGKTTGAGLISQLLLGDKDLGTRSAAAAFAEANQAPILLLDQFESDDMNHSMKNFLLLSATGGNKTKRMAGTDSDVVKESPKTLIITTGIEPFTLPELTNRTVEIDFSVRFKEDAFSGDEVTRELQKKRDLILTSIFKFISKHILPNLESRKSYMAVLKKEYKGHAKDRMDEHISLLMLILDKILPYMPYYSKNEILNGIESGSAEIRRAWIECQNAKARDTEIDSNNILKMLDGIIREYLLRMEEVGLKPDYKYGYEGEVFFYRHPEYGLEVVKTMPVEDRDDDGQRYQVTHIEFEATSGDLAYAFDRFCKNNGLRNPYTKRSVLGARLRNDEETLKAAGWELVAGEKSYPYFRKVEGRRIRKFRYAKIIPL